MDSQGGVRNAGTWKLQMKCSSFLMYRCVRTKRKRPPGNPLFQNTLFKIHFCLRSLCHELLVDHLLNELGISCLHIFRNQIRIQLAC